MLATYFREYPPRLVAIARQQAESINITRTTMEKDVNNGHIEVNDYPKTAQDLKSSLKVIEDPKSPSNDVEGIKTSSIDMNLPKCETESLDVFDSESCRTFTLSNHSNGYLGDEVVGEEDAVIAINSKSSNSKQETVNEDQVNETVQVNGDIETCVENNKVVATCPVVKNEINVSKDGVSNIPVLKNTVSTTISNVEKEQNYVINSLPNPVFNLKEKLNQSDKVQPSILSAPLLFKSNSGGIIQDVRPNTNVRSFSLEFSKGHVHHTKMEPSNIEDSKKRSVSLDYRRLKIMSSSEIASEYMPSSLKDMIIVKDCESVKDARSSKSGSTSSSSRITPRSSKGSTKQSNVSGRSSSDVSRHRFWTPGRKSSLTSPENSIAYSRSSLSPGSCPVHDLRKSSIKEESFEYRSHSLRQERMFSPRERYSISPCGSEARRRKLASVSPSPSVASTSSLVNEIANCGICTQKFKNPKVLPCRHKFCEDCLVLYTPAESLTLTCPICRQQSILPKDGVGGLESGKWNPRTWGTPQKSIRQGPKLCTSCGARATVKCLDCSLALCSRCVHNHDEDSSSSESHSVTSVDDSPSQPLHSESFGTNGTATPPCSIHPGQPLRFFCEVCRTTICSRCGDADHRTHATTLLQDSGLDSPTEQGADEDLRRMVEKFTLQLPCMKEVLCDLTDASEQLQLNQQNSRQEIVSCFESFKKLLEDREHVLLNSLDQHYKAKSTAIETQKRELEQWVTEVERWCEYAETELPNLPAPEVLPAKKQMRHTLVTYCDVEFPPIPRENSHISFVEGNIEFLKTAFKGAGRIQANSAVPQQTTAIGDNLKRIYVERQCIVTVVTRDYKGVRTTSGGAEVKASVAKNVSINSDHDSSPNGDVKNIINRTPKLRKDVSEVQVIDLNDGTYEVFFTVYSIGTYTLSLFLYGQHISASPFILSARMPTDGNCWSDYGSGHREDSFATRKSSLQVSRKSSSGSMKRAPSHKSSCSRRTLREPVEDDLLLRVGRRGRGRGEFVNPQGICYAPVREGRIVVADSNNQCVQVFDLTGECRVKFGIRGRNAGQLQRPTGVASLPDGSYAIADYENKWVSVFEPNGKYVRRIGHGKLLGPKGLCVSNEGNLIVVDNKGSCVFLFSLSGKLLKKFGSRSLEGYNFAGPHFCAVNGNGDIVVTDFHNHCVRVFSSEGVAKFSFGTNGEGNGQFNAPTGVAVDSNHNIIVADWGNSRIQIFDSQGSFLSFVNTAADSLYGPQGLSLTADGSIVVADSGNHCFKLYKYLQ